MIDLISAFKSDLVIVSPSAENSRECTALSLPIRREQCGEASCVLHLHLLNGWVEASKGHVTQQGAWRGIRL